jgi:ribosomal protein S6--L-glutamate ligase
VSLSKSKTIIGREEWCSFSNLGIPAIKARIDSGAKTSSIHAFNIHRFKRNGDSWVSFEVHPLQKNRRTVIRCEKPLVDIRSVKSSSGTTDKRYVINERIKLGEEEWDVELTLANRDSMGYRMLLGREAMSGRMIVDPDLKFCLGKISLKKISEYYGDDQSAKSGLKIGILASDQNLYSNRRMMEAGMERGHEMEFLVIKECYLKIDALEPEVHYRDRKVVDDLDAIITRIRPSITFYGCALARHFESLGVLVANSASAITLSRDKLHSLQLMLKNGISIPTTGFANAPIDTDDLIDMVGGAPLMVKLLDGVHGRKIVLAETRKAAESVIDAFKSLKANLLVQEYIKEANGKDIRCFVIEGKIVAAIERIPAAGEFRAGKNNGGSAIVANVTSAEKLLVLKAAKILDLNFAGVDFIRSKNGALIIDVSSSPDLEEIEVCCGKDIAGMMIASIEKKLAWKRDLSSPK